MNDIALFRIEQAAREKSSRLGLSGLAKVADHDSIEKRMEIRASQVLSLVEQGNKKEACELLEALYEEIASDTILSEQESLPLQAVSHPSPKANSLLVC